MNVAVPAVFFLLGGGQVNVRTIGTVSWLGPLSATAIDTPTRGAPLKPREQRRRASRGMIRTRLSQLSV
jgi:hypothetical protein